MFIVAQAKQLITWVLISKRVWHSTIYCKVESISYKPWVGKAFFYLHIIRGLAISRGHCRATADEDPTKRSVVPAAGSVSNLYICFFLLQHILFSFFTSMPTFCILKPYPFCMFYLKTYSFDTSSRTLRTFAFSTWIHNICIFYLFTCLLLLHKLYLKSATASLIQTYSLCNIL